MEKNELIDQAFRLRERVENMIAEAPQGMCNVKPLVNVLNSVDELIDRLIGRRNINI